MNTEITETPIAEYQPTAVALADLNTKYKDAVFPVTTTKGMTQAKEARAELRGLRVKLEATRKEIKEPALRRCQQIDSEAKRITAELSSLEDPIDKQIKAEEQRKEDEKRAREEAERQRVAAIHAAIAAFGEEAGKMVGQPSNLIRTRIDRMRDAELSTDVFQEFAVQAAAAKAQSLEAMQGTLERQLEHEAEQERIAAERRELEQLRQEAAEREQREQQQRAQREAQERERLAGEQRQREAEAARDARNNAIVRAIRDGAFEFVGAPSNMIQDEITRLQADPDVMADVDGDFVQAAEQAIADAIGKLRQLLETAQRREAEADELRQQRECQEQERRAEEQRQETERVRLAEERRRLEAELLANVTLHDAAQTALTWLTDHGYGREQPARLLQAALRREHARAAA
jgi:colicin import membrane protein